MAMALPTMAIPAANHSRFWAAARQPTEISPSAADEAEVRSKALP
jgi:hypothetical protein